MLDHFKQEAQQLYHIVLSKNSGASHKERMENFYAPQAEGYDGFRKRFLHGRKELYEKMQVPKDGTWVELGGGTGQSLEYLGDRIHELKKVIIVDISKSLLDVAESRAQSLGWTNVECVEADVTDFTLGGRKKADVCTFTYSLSMIPAWFKALKTAHSLLKPEGQIGIVDFFVARKHPIKTHHPKQSLMERSFWPLWFTKDDVFPNPDHLPYIYEGFEEVFFQQGFGKIPYTVMKAPFYQFIGKKK